MDFNKEEANRAKGIAEKKMQDKDFVGARKIALRALQLSPELGNISQLLMVCDVHCSAEQKLYGNEMDWYGILKIEQTANEATIKKQYRKFALLLHPDKNKFEGAEAAFKLIGEAQRVLLDREKRSLHDMKCRASVRKPAAPVRPPHQASRNANFGVQNNFSSNTVSPVMGLNPQHQQPSQSGFSNSLQTFWTVCPYCAVRYQYYREVMSKCISCQNCKRSFMAYEINVHRVPPGSNGNHPAFTQQKDVPDRGACKVNVKSQEKIKRESLPKTGCTSKVGSEKVNCKRKRKQVVDSSESCDTGSSTDTEEDVVVEKDDDLQAGQNFGCYGKQCTRRSNRQKQRVSYNENISDDELFVKPSKRAMGSGSSCAAEECGDATKEEVSISNKQADIAADLNDDQKESSCFEGNLPNGNKETKKVNAYEQVGANVTKKRSKVDDDSAPDSSTKSTPDPEYYVYPDPDFSDFDKDKRVECFAVGQTWAIYDTLDAMPRFHARIRKVLSPGFKLRITWLEPDPDNVNEIRWVNEDLPVSCGKFKHGNTENTEDRLMFSHLVYWEKGTRRDTYKIYPRKGETWALFKNWDINWNSDPDISRNYDFEFVEILSEYAEGVGIYVVYLGKVKGFVSLFCQMLKEGMNKFQILPGEIFKFSHRIPSFKMTGEEREGVPKGSYELDPACLPTNLEEIDVPEDLKVEAGNSHRNGSCSTTSPVEVKPMMSCEGSASAYRADVKETHLCPEENSSGNDIEDCSVHPASTVEAIEIPDSEFYDFDAARSLEKFQIGQIWALYSDEDGLPKYYGQIKKINSHPEVKLHVTWLAGYSLLNNMIQWHDKGMPICCGRFKIRKSESQAYTATTSFSHQLRAEFVANNEYAIFPRKGEVWALYKNWNAEIPYSDLGNCEYDIVEVLDGNDMQISVSVLERVDGFNSIFKAQVKGGSVVTMEIPRVEMLRFSHQIPAFQLTKERGGSLRGFWELDPAALPVYFFCLN